jgi:hypothetical protein
LRTLAGSVGFCPNSGIGVAKGVLETGSSSSELRAFEVFDATTL